VNAAQKGSPRTVFRNKKFLLYEVYEAACRTPKCPIDEMPDQNVERYLEKVKKCGKGQMYSLPMFCSPCKDCDDLRAGPTEEGEKFWLRMQLKMIRNVSRSLIRKYR
jgi:hypothetical protein